MALVTQNEFDVLFGTMYALCCAIEMSMVASHMIWLIRTHRDRKRAKEAGETFIIGSQWQAKGIDIEEKVRHFFSKKSTAEEDGLPVIGVADALANPEEVIPKTVPNAVV
ncbi:unnamed protein product [Alternaria alternata]